MKATETQAVLHIQISKKSYLNLFKKKTLFSGTFCSSVDCKIVGAFFKES